LIRHGESPTALVLWLTLPSESLPSQNGWFSSAHDWLVLRFFRKFGAADELTGQ
jgi:hypothetical protein